MSQTGTHSDPPGEIPESHLRYRGMKHAGERQEIRPLSDRIEAAMRAAVDQKGLDVRALDVSRATDIADCFIIVSGTSERHVRGIADKVQETLARFNEEPTAMSGYEDAEWVLLDYGDLVVHVFYEPTRQYYNLEDLWANRSTVIPPAPELEKELRRLRTGITW